MWYYYILSSLFVFCCILLILVVLIQKGKGSAGLGGFGGSSQLIFGGSGGQDFFQKLTWALGVFFMIGSLVLGYLRQQKQAQSRYIQARAVTQSSSQPAVPTASEPADKGSAQEHSGSAN